MLNEISNDLRRIAKSVTAGNRAMARIDLENILFQLPDDPNAWLIQAWLSDSPDACVSALNRALAIDPNCEVALTGLIWAEQFRDFCEGLNPEHHFEPQKATCDEVLTEDRELAGDESACDDLGHSEPEACEPEACEPEACEPEISERLPSELTNVEIVDDSEDQPEESATGESLVEHAESFQATDVQEENGLHEENELLEDHESHQDNVDCVEDDLLEEVASISADTSVALEQPAESKDEPTYDDVFETGDESPTATKAVTEESCDTTFDTESPSERPLVLAVDDSPTVRKLVAMTLERVGYEVVTAADGVAALNLLAERSPVLILSDINMPRITGYKLCKLVKKHSRTQRIPVVMLSGKNGVFDKVRGQMVGCSDYITKPFESHDLIEKVRQYSLVSAR